MRCVTEHEKGTTIMKLLKDLSESAKSAFGAVENILGETSDKLDSAVSAFSQSANGAMAQAQDAFSAFGEQVAEQAGGLADQAGSAMGALGEQAGELADQAGAAAGSAMDALSDPADSSPAGIGGGLGSIVDAAAQSIDDLAAQAEQAVNSADSDVGQAIDDIASNAKDAIGDAAAAVGDMGEQLAEWGSNAVDRLVAAAKGVVNNVKTQIKNKISLAKSVIANQFQLARSRAEAAVANVANVLKAVYVNAGWWGFGATDFVLVSGCYVVQCSWLGDGEHRCELKPGDDEEDKRAADAIKKFLEDGKSKGDANPTMMGFDEALIPLTDEMMVFMGDMHIHLFRGSPFDSFTTGVGSEKKSLIGVLRDLLDHAEEQGVTAENIIQVGDCFEVWVTQILMDVLCDLYVLAAGVTPAGLAKLLGPILDKCKLIKDVWRPLTDNIDAVGNQEAAIRADFLSKASPKAVADIIIGTDYAKTLPNVAALTNPLDFTDANAVEEAIKDVYEDVWDKFTRVPGNHDNNMPNDYLQQKYGRSSGLRSKDEEYIPLERGKKDCIAIEHGEARDQTNRRDEYDKPNRGFMLTRYFTIKQWNDAVKSDWGAQLWDSSSGHGAMESAGGGDDPSLKVLQQFARARAYDLRTQNATNLQGKKYRLIVLGHSHLTEISPDRLFDEAKELALGGAVRATVPALTETVADYVEGLPTI